MSLENWLSPSIGEYCACREQRFSYDEEIFRRIPEECQSFLSEFPGLIIGQRSTSSIVFPVDWKPLSDGLKRDWTWCHPKGHAYVASGDYGSLEWFASPCAGEYRSLDRIQVEHHVIYIDSTKFVAIGGEDTTHARICAGVSGDLTGTIWLWKPPCDPDDPSSWKNSLFPAAPSLKAFFECLSWFDMESLL